MEESTAITKKIPWKAQLEVETLLQRYALNKLSVSITFVSYNNQNSPADKPKRIGLHIGVCS